MNLSNEYFQLYFKNAVLYKAIDHARALFTERYLKQEHLDTLEEGDQLAHQEAEKFYRSGRIFLMFKASWVGPQVPVTDVYYAGFTEMYAKQINKVREKQANQ